MSIGGLTVDSDTLPKVFQLRVKQYQDRVALREKKFGIWRDVSWREFDANVRRLAYAMIMAGYKRGDRIAVIGWNSPEWVYVDLATQSIGGISIGVYSTSASDQVEYVLEHSGARLFFVENEEQLDKALAVRERLPLLRQIVYWDKKNLQGFVEENVLFYEQFLKLGMTIEKENPTVFDQLVADTKADDIAIMVYTSGTTGPPKGVMLSQRNLLSASASIYKAHPVYDTDELVSFLPLCHIGERTWSVTHAINNGYTVSFAENEETIFQDIRDVKPTIFFAVPRIWEKFYANVVLTVKDSTFSEKLIFRAAMKVAQKVTKCRLGREHVKPYLRILYGLFDYLVYGNTRRMLGLQRCHFIFSGAAPIAPEILSFFHGLGLNIREIYGQTEAGGSISIHQGDDIKLGTVGKPVPDVEVKIGADGEIMVRGQNVFKGYLNDEELTKATLSEGWLLTGDIGRLDEDGNLIITDRKKDIIITSGGKNITPQYIENKLKFSPYINDAIVIGDGRKYLTALIMIDEENVVKFAQEQKIPFTTYSSLTKAQEITELISKEVNNINKSLSSVEQVKYFRLIDIRLTAEDEEITPTMKLKRKYIQKRFGELIESMY